LRLERVLQPRLSLPRNFNFYLTPFSQNAHPFRTPLTTGLDGSNMLSPELSARLRYLNDSAHLLANTAPSTSRQLRSRCDVLMSENDLAPSDAHRQDACGACGTIMVLGWVGTMKTGPQPSRRRKPRPDGQAIKQTKALIYECKTCHRKTRFPLSEPPPATRYKNPSSTSRLLSTSQSLTKPMPSSLVPEARSNSKKRAKARKRGGLEALLTAKKAGPEASGFGLDLMDFMKKS
jgi:RNase P subunit RPR2